MSKINAVITGVGGYVPDYVLNNDELSRMVDTNDEWIMSRVGIKERRILNEEGLGTSYMARKAAKQLLQKTGTDPDSIDAIIVATSTADYKFPSTASIVLGKLGLKNAFAMDFSAACCGFLYTLDVAAGLIQSGRYKKIIVIFIIQFCDQAVFYRNGIFTLHHFGTPVTRCAVSKPSLSRECDNPKPVFEFTLNADGRYKQLLPPLLNIG